MSPTKLPVEYHIKNVFRAKKNLAEAVFIVHTLKCVFFFINVK